MNLAIFKNKQNMREFIRKYGTVLGALVLFIVFSLLIERFLTPSNIMMLLRQMSMLTIIALGFTFVMGAGGFDMSIGTLCGLVMMLFALTLLETGNLLLALLVAIACGLVIGLINGLLVAYIGLPDFIATFAVGSIIMGIKMMLTRGNPISYPADIPRVFTFIGQGFIGPFPFPVLIMFFVLVLAVFVIYKTSFGRRVYAIGGNPVASLYAGINVKKYRLATFLISGFSVSLASIILTSRLGSAQPLAGEEFLLDVIAVVFLSTTMFGEGEPTPGGTFIGALMISMLNNGLTMLNVQYYFQFITKGSVVILAVLLAVSFGQKLRIKF